MKSTGTATLIADYTTTAQTTVSSGTLAVTGAAEQTGGTFQLLNRSQVATPGLGIRDGILLGDGTVNGNLVMGYPAQDNKPPTTPIISPGGGVAIGTTNVNGNFHMFSGRMDIEVCGPDVGQYDRVAVTGYAAFTVGPAGAARDVFTNILPVHWYIPATTYIPFLTYSSLIDDFANRFVASPWSYDKDGTEYWVWTHDAISANLARITGKAWLDNGAQPGVREAGEGGKEGVTVRLFDEAGANQVASTTTDADGNFSFEGVAAGVYVAEFAPPAGMRFARANVGDPGTDSDPDPANGRVRVAVYDDVTDLDAGLYADTAPAATNRTARAHKNTPTSGNVRCSPGTSFVLAA